MEAHCVALLFERQVRPPLLLLVLALLLCEVWREAHSFVACAVSQLTGSSQHLDALGGVTNLHKHRGGWIMGPWVVSLYFFPCPGSQSLQD